MSAIGSVIVMSRLPRTLRHTGKLTSVRHLAYADAAQAEHAVDRTGPTASGAAGVAAHLELRLAPSLGDHRLRFHASGLLERKAERAQQRAPLVVCSCTRHDRDVHASRPVDGVWIDLVEHRLL